MRKFIITFVAATFTVAAPAQQALQCANPDVLNSLVFNARSESRLVVSRGMPDSVAGFRAPAGFALIGSGIRGQGRSTVVAYKTTQETGKAFDDLLGFLSAEGWSRESAPQGQQPAFTIVERQQSAAVTLCRNGERRNMLVQEIEGIRYATIVAFQTGTARDCGALAPQQGFSSPMATMNAASGIMPQFSFPATARMSGGPGAGNMGGGNDVSSSMRIESSDTAASLAGVLARQLREQGWRGDAEWKGALSTGSTWMRRNDAGQAFWGTLEILNLGKGIYDIGYSVTTRPQ